MKRSFWFWWAGVNLVLAIGAPVLFAQWIAREVAEEYRLGYRVSTDGDSISIPIAGFSLNLWSVQLFATLLAVLLHLILRRRARERASVAQAS